MKPLLIPSDYMRYENAPYCYKVEWGSDSLKALRNIYREQLEVPKFIHDILHLNPNSDDVKFLTECPEMIQWSKDGDFMMIINYPDQNHFDFIKNPQPPMGASDMKSKLQKLGEGLELIAWHIHPSQLKGTVFENPENRKDFRKALAAQNTIQSDSLVDVSQVPYYASIFDLNINSLDFLNKFKTFVQDTLREKFKISEKDIVDLSFHGPINKANSTLHLHVRINQGIHPMEKRVRFTLDEVIMHLMNNKGVIELAIEKQPYYCSAASQKEVSEFQNLPETQVTRIPNPFLVNSREVEAGSNGAKHYAGSLHAAICDTIGASDIQIADTTNLGLSQNKTNAIHCRGERFYIKAYNPSSMKIPLDLFMQYSNIAAERGLAPRNVGSPFTVKGDTCIYIISEEAQGSHVPFPTITQIEALGKKLAQLHNIGAECLNCHTNINNLANESMARPKVPSGIIHSDINPYNMLYFDNGEFNAFIDFEHAQYGSFILDIAKTISQTFLLYYSNDKGPKTSILLQENPSATAIISAMLKGYQSVRELSVEEKKELPILIQQSFSDRLREISDRMGQTDFHGNTILENKLDSLLKELFRERCTALEL